MSHSLCYIEHFEGNLIIAFPLEVRKWTYTHFALMEVFRANLMRIVDSFLDSVGSKILVQNECTSVTVVESQDIVRPRNQVLLGFIF